jgi:hypothetical protein
MTCGIVQYCDQTLPDVQNTASAACNLKRGESPVFIKFQHIIAAAAALHRLVALQRLTISVFFRTILFVRRA